jgi:protein-disulfide isomerase
MNKQRLLIFSMLTLVFVGVSLLYFRDIWTDMTTRYRTGTSPPAGILPNELRSPQDIVPSGPPRAPEIRKDDPLLSGYASSAITIIEFGDFQCDYCREQTQAVEDALKLTDRQNDVRVVWRDLPLTNQHPNALAAATVARCAGQQGMFKPMHDALFFQAKDLSETEFLTFAKQMKLNMDTFMVCLRDPAIPFRLNQDIDLARSLAITEVPMLFLNGQPETGYVDAETLAAWIRNQLGVKK